MTAAIPWVLLRGVARDARHWAGLPGRLEARFGASVRCVDLAGNGGRWRELSRYSIADNVDDMRHQLSDLPGPVRVLAISMGAMVALEWARRRPGEIASMVLINTSLGGLSPWHRRFRPARLPALLPAFLRRDPERRERVVLANTSQAGATPSRVVEWTGWAKQTPVSGANALRQLGAAARYRIACKPDVPILLLASRGDRLVDPRCSRDIAQAWSCLLHEHPEAGHDLPLDDPDWVVARIAEWDGCSMSG